MERFIDGLIRGFERGALGRREFCQMLGLAAAIAAVGGAEANAASGGRGFKALGINHIAYRCPDYRQARDFFANIFDMQVLNDKGHGRANLAFGPAPGQGGTYILVHGAGPNLPNPAEAVIDHFCVTISNWDEATVDAAMKKNGYDKLRGRLGSRHIYDPFDYDVQFANAVEENVFKR